MKTFLLKSAAPALLLSLILSGLSAQEPLKEPNTVSPRLATLKRQLQGGDSGALERFWQEIAQQGTPLVEPLRENEEHVLVTFLWRGGEETRNVVIFSAMTTMYGFDRGDVFEHQMERIAATDVWFKTYRLPRDARFAYYLSPNDSLIPADEIKDYAEWERRAATWVADALNPHRESRPHADKDWVVSVVELPGAPPKPWLGYRAKSQGGIQERRVPHGPGERRVWIYTPPEYAPAGKPYPLVVSFDGSADAAKKTSALLDYLIGEDLIEPVVAAGVEQKERWPELNCSEEFSSFLTSDLVPWLRANFHVTSAPSQTVISGGSLGGLQAFCAALKYPEVFGNLISTSGAFSWPEYGWIMRQYAVAPKVPLRAYLDVGTFEVDMDALLYANRHMRDVLLARGYEVHYAEFTGGHDSTHSDIGFADGLKVLLPKHAASSARTIDLQPIRLLTLKNQMETGDSGALERFWQEIAQRGTPLVEPLSGDEKHVLVTFLWREKEPVRKIVLMLGIYNWSTSRSVLPDIQMAHLPGTDVWYKTYRIRSDARFTYLLAVNHPLVPEEDQSEQDGGSIHWQPDPLNPKRVAYPKDEERQDSVDEVESVAELPNAPSQLWIVRAAGVPQGEVVLHRFRSTLLGNERRIWVYTPPDYEPEGSPLRLLILFDGRDHLHNVPVPTILDNLLAARRIPQTIAVLVDNPTPEARRRELGCNPVFNRFLAEELLPWVRQKFNVSRNAKDAVVGGRSRGGLAATCAAMEHPELFGNVLSQAGAFRPFGNTERDQQLRDGWLMEQFASRPKLPLRFYLDVGIYDNDPPSFLESSRHMRDVLRAKGYPLFYQEFVGHHDSINWRGTLPDGLRYLLNPELSGDHDSTHSDIGFVEGLKALLPKSAASGPLGASPRGEPATAVKRGGLRGRMSLGP